MTKNYLSCSMSQEPCIIWLSFIVHMCNMIISPGVFSVFSKFWFFRLLGGGGALKGWKMVKNDKKVCPLDSISQEPYITWVSFMVHMCKMVISPGVFLLFSKLWFFGLLGGKKSKKTVQNDKKFCLSHFLSQEPSVIWLSFIVHVCKMIIYPGIVFIFSKFWFFRLSGGKKAKKGPKWPKILTIVFHISGTIHYMTIIYGTNL